jgi:hypothetical protein
MQDKDETRHNLDDRPDKRGKIAVRVIAVTREKPPPKKGGWRRRRSRSYGT